jgi:hypothetical protein
MSTSNDPIKSEGAWAQPVERLKVSALQGRLVNINVEGRRLAGPVQGFGPMWQKTYTIRLDGTKVDPRELISVWKENFGSFWPRGNHYYSRFASIAPGQVAVLNLSGPGGINAPGGGPMISTGILVIYADEDSFAFMTPEGHMFAGMITFSAFREGGDTIACIQALVRSSDPLYELTFRLGIGHQMEDSIWMHTLRSLAAHFKAAAGQPMLKAIVVDPHFQWREARNIWQNAAIRTTFYTLAAPLRWLRGRAR